ncbi:sigma-70 family RNA polymerase sigma factor [Flavisolibacter tropicus]|uniref:RNA polymerase sigma factor rpoD n=1 Tax=Flavisolibacter tropicus TaxID=1492898 RepID=A0A172TVZ8_9BACT|nr:RNA polymerase sigma factor RpoD/SigA [Flavisolibacter tropicus]ANE50917.1 RNA polymerase sigma factor rpoD [Flavisolibacter tropicus]
MRQLKISQSITNREARSFERYLQEIGKLELISLDEEVRLASLIQQGDQQAVDALIKANLRFVVSVAKQYQHMGFSLPDLVHEGNVGLIRAARQFDVTRGFKFISYAVWWVRQSILQSIIEHARMIRLPSNRALQQNRIQKVSLSLYQTLEREPSSAEIAEEMQIDIAEVSVALNGSSRHISLDAPLSEAEETCLADTIANEDTENIEKELFQVESLRIEVMRVLQVLTVRQREVICDYYGIGLLEAMSLDEIGEKFCLSGERVRQIKESAIVKLRTSQKHDLLRSYLCS